VMATFSLMTGMWHAWQLCVFRNSLCSHS